MEVANLKDIVLKAIKGDAQSLCKLIEDKKNSIYKIAYSYVNNREDALDIVQEVVYKVYCSITGLRQPEYFNTWVTRITINCSINHINKSKKVVYVSEYFDEDVSDEFNGTEEIMDLRTALEKLEIKYKTVVILRYFEDMTLEEISRTLEIPLNTVKTHLYRALKILRIKLEEVEDIE